MLRLADTQVRIENYHDAIWSWPACIIFTKLVSTFTGLYHEPQLFASSLRADALSDSPTLLRNDAQTSFAICYPVRRTSPVSKILSGFFSTSTGWIANPSCVLAVVARVRLVRFTSALEDRRARECDKLPRSHMHVGCLKTNSGIYSFKKRGNKYSHARLCFAIVAASFPCLSVSCELPTTQKTPFGPRPVHNRSIVQKRAWFVNLKYLSTNL